ncbi:transient receptor potential channel pyrexia-like isoform X1 [Penaeus indicus]|uniref:transient receptor potential channel pyrexia-like isoform X1 n=2 Tax=Penaeus indicus TaxID=29960 RepID=UPI00300D667E
MRFPRHMRFWGRRYRNDSQRSDLSDDVYQHMLCLKPDRKTSVVSTEAAYSRMTLGLSSDGSMFSRLSSDSLDARMTIPPLFIAIQNGELGTLTQILTESPELLNTLKYGGFTALHTACHVRQHRVLRMLLDHGAKVGVMDTLGHTPLHLAVHEGWHQGVAELLRRGASPNILSETPQSVKEVRVETPLHAAIRHGDLAVSTLMMQYQTDLSIRDGDRNTVHHLAAYARSIDIFRMLMREKVSNDTMTAGNREGNTVLHMALKCECDAAEEPLLMELVTLLIEKGADVNAINLKGESPLFLASRLHCPKVVELLLSSGADPTVVTRRGQSVLHAACHSGCASSLSQLLNTKRMEHLVTQADNESKEPFHYAVHRSSIDCCELLLNNGDHLTRKDAEGESRCSLVLEHLPGATQLLRRLFDARVKLSNKPQYDPDFRVTFDYSVLLSPDMEDVQSSLMSELSTTRIESLLKHPLLESFLFIKWRKIKPFFYCSVLVYFTFLILHTSFLISKFGSINTSMEGMVLIKCLHIVMFFLILIPDLIIMLANLKKYLRQWETFSKMIALGSSAFVVFSFTPSILNELKGTAMQVNETDANVSSEVTPDGNAHHHHDSPIVRHVAAVSAFFGWVEFMMLLGRFPSLGAYVLMFTRVAKSITKFIVAFSSLLIGFSISFTIIFKNDPVFRFPYSLVKTLMMMIGEIEYGDLAGDSDMQITRSLFLVLFLFLVCILMANLLIGLAVNDIPDLQRQGKIKRLAKQASYLVSYEKLMWVARSLRCFPRRMRILLTSRVRILPVVTVFPSRENKSRRHQQHIPSETLQEAILLGTCEDPKMEDLSIEGEDFSRQFKSFKIKYDRDWRSLNRRLGQLADCSTTDKILRERLDQMQKMMETQMLQMSIQLQQHNKNLLYQSMMHQPVFQQIQHQNRPQYQQVMQNQNAAGNEVSKSHSVQDLSRSSRPVNALRRASQHDCPAVAAGARNVSMAISTVSTLPPSTQFASVPHTYYTQAGQPHSSHTQALHQQPSHIFSFTTQPSQAPLQTQMSLPQPAQDTPIHRQSSEPHHMRLLQTQLSPAEPDSLSERSEDVSLTDRQ